MDSHEIVKEGLNLGVSMLEKVYDILPKFNDGLGNPTACEASNPNPPKYKE